jgi:hypothetical protein
MHGSQVLNIYQPRCMVEFLLQRRNTPDSYLSAMTLDTKRTLVLLQEILLALRANDADGFKGKARSRSWTAWNASRY